MVLRLLLPLVLCLLVWGVRADTDAAGTPLRRGGLAELELRCRSGITLLSTPVENTAQCMTAYHQTPHVPDPYRRPDQSGDWLPE